MPSRSPTCSGTWTTPPRRWPSLRAWSAGGTVALLEFAVPEAWWAAPAWRGYTRAVMPAVGSIVSPAWAHTGRFLGPSIENYWREHPLDDQLADWDAAGIGGVRWRRMSNGAAIVLWGRIR